TEPEHKYTTFQRRLHPARSAACGPPPAEANRGRRSGTDAGGAVPVAAEPYMTMISGFASTRGDEACSRLHLSTWPRSHRLRTRKTVRKPAQSSQTAMTQRHADTASPPMATISGFAFTSGDKARFRLHL